MNQAIILKNVIDGISAIGPWFSKIDQAMADIMTSKEVVVLVFNLRHVLRV